MDNILEVSHLITRFPTANGDVLPVNDVSLTVKKGGITGIVGESGCGKSMTARSIMRLLKYPGEIIGGEVLLDGQNLLNLSEREMADVRGSALSMIFQEPMTSLNPVMKSGRQVQEAILLHRSVSAKAAKNEVLEMFERVGIAEPRKRYDAYPHELSGGLRQRVLIAMAMICRPKLLIADEPTTALDVTVEAQILDLMRRLRDETGAGVILISHNLGVIAQICDSVNVMYAGRIVEQAETFDLFARPTHPYTNGLLRSVRSLENRGEQLETIRGAVPLLNALPKGCGFAPRCDRCTAQCADRAPEMTDIGNDHFVRCGEVSSWRG